MRSERGARKEPGDNVGVSRERIRPMMSRTTEWRSGGVREEVVSFINRYSGSEKDGRHRGGAAEVVSAEGGAADQQPAEREDLQERAHEEHTEPAREEGGVHGEVDETLACGGTEEVLAQQYRHLGRLRGDAGHRGRAARETLQGGQGRAEVRRRSGAAVRSSLGC